MNRIARIVLQPGNFIVEGVQRQIDGEIGDLYNQLELLQRHASAPAELNLPSTEMIDEVAKEIATKDASLLAWDKMRTPLNLAAYGLYATPVAWGISNSYNDMVNEELRQRQRAMLAQQGVYPR